MQADIWRSNLYGAAAVIMQDHAKEFIEFLAAKIDTDYFSDLSIRENFRLFSFDSQKTRDSGAIPEAYLRDLMKKYSALIRNGRQLLRELLTKYTSDLRL